MKKGPALWLWLPVCAISARSLFVFFADLKRWSLPHLASFALALVLSYAFRRSKLLLISAECFLAVYLFWRCYQSPEGFSAVAFCVGGLLILSYNILEIRKLPRSWQTPLWG